MTAKYTLLRLLRFALLEIRHDAGKAQEAKKSAALADLFHTLPMALAQHDPDYDRLLQDINARAAGKPWLKRWVAANTPHSRTLPSHVLADWVNPESLEAQDVAAKFSDPAAIYANGNIDHGAMMYFNPAAAAYWLPRYFVYLRRTAPKDSYHFDAILNRLIDPDWKARMAEILSDDERAEVLDFILWLQDAFSYLDPVRAVDYAAAVTLWST